MSKALGSLLLGLLLSRGGCSSASGCLEGQCSSADGPALPSAAMLQHGHAQSSALCSDSVVKAACYELTGEEETSVFTPMELAEAFNTDLDSSQGMLDTIGLNKSSVKCSTLCTKVTNSIPASLRPPAPMVGHRFASNGSLVWDVDLSDSVLDGILIPDGPPEHAAEGTAKKTSFLQELHAGKFDSLSARGGSGYTPYPLKAHTLLYMVANAFDIYPAERSEKASPSSHSQSLMEEDGGDCDEAIYGSGVAYKGCQKKTTRGKTCTDWSAKGGKSPKNYCRNPDGSRQIWCWTGNSASDWGYCEPKGAPVGFTKATNELLVYAKAWMTRSLAHFNAYHLPTAYQKWMGPSETTRSGVTKQGCSCKKSWLSDGKTITDHCGNPDNDAGGDWCYVTEDATGKSCQGATWGYCAPKGVPKTVTRHCKCKKSWTSSGTTITDYCGNPDGDVTGNWCMVEDTKCQGVNWGYCQSLCGPECQKLRERLVQTEKFLSQLTFKYDGASAGAYAYIMAASQTKKLVPVNDAVAIQSSYKQGDKVKMVDTTWSKTIDGRKEIVLCPAWWEIVEPCKDKLDSCSRNSLGTAIGTLVHETMHHYPMGFDDYLYYRNVVQKFVEANHKSSSAVQPLKDCADCVEYFLADNNGFTDTGR